MAAEAYNVTIIGGPQEGKTRWVREVLGAENPDPGYVPTVGAEVHPHTVATTAGEVQLLLWDTAGEEKYAGLRDGYLIAARAVVCFPGGVPPGDVPVVMSGPDALRDICRLARGNPHLELA